jgi:hypothetical protein
MADWYCDFTNGDDADAGTALLPKKTLQATINVATNGDNIFIANTSAQVLAATITWNTGYTATGNVRLSIKAWDNGGSLTIQRPDEATPRIAAVIDGGGVAVDPFVGAGTRPNHFSVENIRFQNFTTHAYREMAGYSFVSGCEFNGSTVGNNIAVRFESSGRWGMFFNNYVHSYTGTANAITGNGMILNNFIETASTSASGQLWLNARNISAAVGNIIKTIGGTAIFTGQREIQIIGNTIIGNGAASAKGIVTSGTADSQIYNNVVYNYNGTSAKPLSIESPSSINNFVVIGNNAFYNSNAADTTASAIMDFQPQDITASGDPFVDSANNNFTLIEAAAARQAALANPNSKLDIGAVQSEYGSGGGAVTRGSAWVG